MSILYIYIYICHHENNVPSRSSPQWLYDNSYTWEHDVGLHTAGTNESKSAQRAKQGVLLYIYIYIYITRLEVGENKFDLILLKIS